MIRCRGGGPKSREQLNSGRSLRIVRLKKLVPSYELSWRTRSDEKFALGADQGTRVLVGTRSVRTFGFGVVLVEQIVHAVTLRTQLHRDLASRMG